MGFTMSLKSIFIFAHLMLCTSFLVAGELTFEDKQISFTINCNPGSPRKIQAYLSAESQKHIFIGQSLKNGYSGGHDWDVYFENHVKNDPNAEAYFDTNLSAYIVKSKKGDSLLEIMEILRSQRAFPKHHSLFPSAFLRKEGLILNAFKKAYLSFALKGEGTIDHNKNLFYTEVDGVKVAGKFECHGDEYEIMTFYPDIDWYYRISFRHNDEFFNFSRFIKYCPLFEAGLDASIWLQRANYNEDLSKCLKFLPQPIVLKRFWDSDELLQNSEYMIIREKIEIFLQRKFFGPNPQNIADFREYLFANKENPTPQEVKDFFTVLKLFMPHLKIKYSESEKVQRNLLRLELALGKSLKSAPKNDSFINIEMNSDNSFRQYPTHGNVRLNLQFFSNMLNLKAGYSFSPDNTSFSADIKRIVMAYYERFAEKFLADSNLLERMREEKYFIGIKAQEISGINDDRKKIVVAFRLLDETKAWTTEDRPDVGIGLQFKEGPLELINLLPSFHD
jgi:hypothetical protein